MKVIGVIPARYDSTRLPGKPLIKIKGWYLIELVYNQVVRCKNLDEVIIATDDRRIKNAAESFGASAVMTSKKCKSGTDRLAEVARQFKTTDIFINIQGDEPLISPMLIDNLAKVMKKDVSIEMATAAYPIKEKADINDPNIVKVVLDKDNNALYFSRFAVPFNRDKSKTRYLKHIGLYGYRRDFILKFSSWSQTLLEKTEKLEQLRALENGCKIKVIISATDSIGVDTPEDVKKIERILGAKK